MIVGNGLVANAIRSLDRKGVTFLAAGVSDSKCKDLNEYEREQKLVEKIVEESKGDLLVYFSTYSVNDPAMRENLYVKRKLEIESYISTHCSSYIIVRISNLVGQRGNPKNVFNFFYYSIVTGQRFSLWSNARRNLITEEDFVKVVNHILEVKAKEGYNCIVNAINSRSFSVLEIVQSIENYTGIQALYELVEIESVPINQEQDADRWFADLEISTDEYLKKILDKYYKEREIVL